jgi:nucleoside-diphosphate-sugar epimerase
MVQCLVTGGSGFFGSLMVRMLRERGFSVRTFDLNEPDEHLPDIEFVRGDIRDGALVEQACGGVDVVYHAIAQQPLAKDKRLFWSVNVEGTENLFRAALKNKVRKVIHLSSSAVLGIPPKGPFDESVMPVPREAYGKAKWEAEKLAAQYVRQGADITIIRPSTILGPGRLGTFSILFDWVRSHTVVPVLGRGENRSQFVHIADLASASLLAAEKSGAETFNIGTDRVETMREMYDALIRHAGSRSRVISLPMGLTVTVMRLLNVMRLSPLGEYHVLMYGRDKIFDSTKARTQLGWTPRYSNTEMLCEAYDWFCANYEKIRSDTGRPLNSRFIRQGVLGVLKWLS